MTDEELTKKYYAEVNAGEWDATQGRPFRDVHSQAGPHYADRVEQQLAYRLGYDRVNTERKYHK